MRHKDSCPLASCGPAKADTTDEHEQRGHLTEDSCLFAVRAAREPRCDGSLQRRDSSTLATSEAVAA